MLRHVTAFLMLLFAAGLATADDKADGITKALKGLQGEWQAIVMVHSGQDAPDEAIKENKVIIKDDMITFVQGDMKFKYKIKIDPSQSPMHFDIVSLEGPRMGKTVPGIYALEKDTLQICFPNDPEQEDKRPKELKTKARDGLSLLGLEKIK